MVSPVNQGPTYEGFSQEQLKAEGDRVLNEIQQIRSRAIEEVNAKQPTFFKYTAEDAHLLEEKSREHSLIKKIFDERFGKLESDFSIDKLGKIISEKLDALLAESKAGKYLSIEEVSKVQELSAILSNLSLSPSNFASPPAFRSTGPSDVSVDSIIMQAETTMVKNLQEQMAKMLREPSLNSDQLSQFQDWLEESVKLTEDISRRLDKYSSPFINNEIK